MSANYLRFGLILTVTGILALVHSLLTSNGVLPRKVALIVGIVLVVVGTPLLVIALRRRRSAS